MTLDHVQRKEQSMERYETQKAWSNVHGLWGYRIFDNQRGVFVSPWYALAHRAAVVADNLNSR